MKPLPWVFANRRAAAILGIATVGWAARESGYIARIVDARGADVRDRRSLEAVLGAVLGSIVGAGALTWAVPRLAFPGRPWPRFAGGIGLIVGGVWLRSYAIRVLGRHFTPVVATRPDQRVVREGPYRLVRHPSYSGALVSILGLGIALGNWASLALLALGSLAGFGYRVAVEERALLAALGPEYAEYMQGTRRLIPWVY